MRNMLTIRETVSRAAEEGIPISEYSMRNWIRMGKIPARKAGRTILIYWPNVVSFITCADGVGDIIPPAPNDDPHGRSCRFF